eukprot:CAMPEP_0196156302 /NCGR_PEP_ID=MMETSP0910-20130528/42127_1 /TAXON_ID=49265 /ORGANISM="Thalassiosira rotula, Strain GSO102" /LENGTH=128 /DNA_ID=CAMNT_0041420717 /DNA_START=57 /DNA_END=440 /DNA_ORIENTATION=+
MSAMLFSTKNEHQSILFHPLATTLWDYDSRTSKSEKTDRESTTVGSFGTSTNASTEIVDAHFEGIIQALDEARDRMEEIQRERRAVAKRKKLENEAKKRGRRDVSTRQSKKTSARKKSTNGSRIPMAW